MDCPRPIKSVLPRFYPTWSSRTRPSMRIQRSEGLGSRLQFWTFIVIVTFDLLRRLLRMRAYEQTDKDNYIITRVCSISTKWGERSPIFVLMDDPSLSVSSPSLHPSHTFNIV